MYKKYMRLFVSAALALSLAAGCGTTSPAPPASNSEAEAESSEAQGNAAAVPDTAAARPAVEGERLYTLELDETTELIFAQDGSEIIPIVGEEQSESDFIPLMDLQTGEARYQFRRREEIFRNEEGYPQIRWLRSLYDMDGNQLLDWEWKNYSDAFGEYIIRQDVRDGMVSMDDLLYREDYQTALYHVPTGTEAYAGAFSAGKLADNAFLLFDTMSSPMGVIDASGGIVSGFPTPKPYYGANVWEGYIIASSTNPYDWTKEERGEQYLLDISFNEVASFDWLSQIYGSLRGDYLAYQNGDSWGIFHPTDGTVFETGGASIEYYDGELAITQTGSYRSEEEPISAALVTRDGKTLAEGFSWLLPDESYYMTDENSPAARFVGIKGGKAVLLGRDGNVLASSEELPGVYNMETLCDGFYRYSVEDGEFYGSGLLGRELEIMLPALRNAYIHLDGYGPDGGEWDGDLETALILVHKEIGSVESGRLLYRVDVLDNTGKPIVDNVTEVYGIGPDRIALKRGFDAGLMDWSGDWIVKRRIFQGLGDD